MTPTDRWGPAVAGATLALPFLLAAALFRPALPLRAAPPVSPERADTARMTSFTDSLGRVAERRAPFRVDGRPSPVPYDPARLDQPVGDRPPRPQLSLTGVVGGNVPGAVIAGIPGRDGPLLLNVGDTAGGLRVVAIRNGGVTVRGSDTTWMLRVKEGP